MRFFRIFELYLFEYKISGSFLEAVNTFTDLGVIYSYDFSFLPHLNIVISKAFRNLGWIKRSFRPFTDIGAIKVLYNSFVLPPLIFASVICSPYTKNSIDRIERVQHGLLRYLAFKNGIPMSFHDHDYRAHSVNFNVPTIMSLHSYHDCTLAYLIYKNCAKKMLKYINK